jgi:hypothetical protein
VVRSSGTIKWYDQKRRESEEETEERNIYAGGSREDLDLLMNQRGKIEKR